MIRILQCVNDMHRAGLETMLMNYYRNIDRFQIQFDFLTHRPYKSDYDDEIMALGGKIYHAPRLYPQNYLQYIKFMKQFFKEHAEYKIIHSHIDSMSYLPLLTAKKAGVPIRIAHSHNTAIDKDLKLPLKSFFKSQITKSANYYCACGDEAGKFLFPGKKFSIIPNAIEIDKFLFSPGLRDKIRCELNIKGKFVVGHVGRLSYQKNHEFLIEIFRRILYVNKNAILLLIGSGEREKVIRKKVQEYNIDSNVVFLGNRSDVNRLYQAMDVFVMPSLFEGIPVVGVEAQFANLPCFFSDKVPKEVSFTERCSFISLNDPVDLWAEQILHYQRDDGRRDVSDLGNRIYNIKQAKNILTKYYLDLLQGI